MHLIIVYFIIVESWIPIVIDCDCYCTWTNTKNKYYAPCWWNQDKLPNVMLFSFSFIEQKHDIYSSNLIHRISPMTTWIASQPVWRSSQNVILSLVISSTASVVMPFMPCFKLNSWKTNHLKRFVRTIFSPSKLLQNMCICCFSPIFHTIFLQSNFQLMNNLQ